MVLASSLGIFVLAGVNLEPKAEFHVAKALTSMNVLVGTRDFAVVTEVFGKERNACRS